MVEKTSKRIKGWHIGLPLVLIGVFLGSLGIQLENALLGVESFAPVSLFIGGMVLVVLGGISSLSFERFTGRQLLIIRNVLFLLSLSLIVSYILYKFAGVVVQWFV